MATTRSRNQSIWRIKPIDIILKQGDETDKSLKRTLGPISITAMGVGAIVGTGIFVLTGIAAANYAGPGLILSFIVAGIASGLAAICYAEFASSVPISGSAYTYSYATLGEIVAWIIGWDLILEYAVGAAAVSIGWAGYFTDLFRGVLGIHIPVALTSTPFSGGIINLPAVIIILLITILLICGTSESSTFNNVVVSIKILVILFFIIIGIGHINPANWHPFLPYGAGGVFRGASIIFFAYIGFDQISTSAEEARNPSRDLPLGIITSLIICTILYISVTAVLTGMVSYTQLNVASPVSHALILIGLNIAGSIISVGALCGLTTVLLVLLYGQSRIFFAMARDGLLPGFFSHIHPRFRTPYLSSILVGIVVALVAGFTPIDIVAELTNIGTLAAFVLVSGAILILRKTQPDLRRKFRVPFVPVVPILSMLASLVLVVSLPLITIGRFIIWLILGLIVYFAYSKRTSHLERDRHVPAPPHDVIT
ncbi:amino acid permease [Dictyobacter arantiisoli]|uniref:Amino acid permease n=1 Tax=Dictyobacter arantiisoli TaxID=2014874 RepID=A0A5A5TE92_9CHLR|nr:amino acid permease [Dictyobacter arantiisoli]GCF09742.1 amino acid permease [Dictyobacter arantiisoli]